MLCPVIRFESLGCSLLTITGSSARSSLYLNKMKLCPLPAISVALMIINPRATENFRLNETEEYFHSIFNVIGIFERGGANCRSIFPQKSFRRSMKKMANQLEYSIKMRQMINGWTATYSENRNTASYIALPLSMLENCTQETGAS